MATPNPSEKAVKLDSNSKSKALQKCFGDVVRAISVSDPLNVGVHLVSASLISQETLSKILTVPATPLANSTTLVMSVLEQVKIMPDKLETFIEILQKSIEESSFQSKLLV